MTLKFVSRCVLALFFAAAAGASSSSSPDSRQATDPKSVVSVDAPETVPVPIDDLFFTRATSGGSWSPDGKEIAFTSNFTGRANLWKVSADGGWPLQMSQSDDRQQGGAWSHDGRWILYSSDRG